MLDTQITMIFDFNPVTILNWSAYVPRARSPLENHEDLDASMIPAMLKRRCSLASKIALSLAIKALSQHEIDYGVFCSQHGELDHTLALFDQIQQQETLSPARFSLSVHNTASGLFSICQKLAIPLVSVAAREQTFLAGVIEALTWLQINPHKTVLLVMFDEAIPTFYQPLNFHYQDEYGVALLLSNKKSVQPTFHIQLLPQIQQQALILPPALVFLTWYLEKQNKCLLQTMGTQSLQWVRHD